MFEIFWPVRKVQRDDIRLPTFFPESNKVVKIKLGQKIQKEMKYVAWAPESKHTKRST